MHITIEIDGDWTWGFDWHKKIKGIRLGFIAIHLISMKLQEFMDLYAEKYHQDRIKLILEKLKEENEK